jgi:hypothetical protein
MFTRMISVTAVLCAAAVVLPVATADIVGDVLSVTVETEDGYHGVWSGTESDGYGTWDVGHTTYTWVLPWDISIYAIEDGTLEIGRLVADPNGDGTANEFVMTYYEDPTVNLNFAAMAGNTTTQFTFQSALLDIVPDIGAAFAVADASAGFTVTDIGGTNGGATLTGMTSTGRGYLAQYNGFAGTESGTTFTQAFTSLSAGAFSSNSASHNVGPTALGVTAADMSSMVKFSLTRRDLASGTSTYNITPEPGSLALLALGIALLRRR